MKSRASSHFIILVLIVFLTAIAHYSIYYGALIRGYETSFLTAGHYIEENYSPEKKQIMGLPPTPPEPVDLSKETPRPVNDTLFGVLFSGRSLIPLFAIFCMIGVIWLMQREDVLSLLQNNGFPIVL